VTGAANSFPSAIEARPAITQLMEDTRSRQRVEGGVKSVDERQPAHSQLEGDDTLSATTILPRTGHIGDVECRSTCSTMTTARNTMLHFQPSSPPVGPSKTTGDRLSLQIQTPTGPP